MLKPHKGCGLTFWWGRSLWPEIERGVAWDKKVGLMQWGGAWWEKG